MTASVTRLVVNIQLTITKSEIKIIVENTHKNFPWSEIHNTSIAYTPFHNSVDLYLYNFNISTSFSRKVSN